MAGTLTHTPRQAASGSIARHDIALLSDSSGNCTGTTSRITGTILRVQWVPDSGGTKPSDNFDVTVSDEGGTDILGGQGANMDADAPFDMCPGQPFTDGTTTSVAPITINDTLSVSASNMGSAKGAKIILYTKDT